MILRTNSGNSLVFFKLEPYFWIYSSGLAVITPRYFVSCLMLACLVFSVVIYFLLSFFFLIKPSLPESTETGFRKNLAEQNKMLYKTIRTLVLSFRYDFNYIKLRSLDIKKMTEPTASIFQTSKILPLFHHKYSTISIINRISNILPKLIGQSL